MGGLAVIGVGSICLAGIGSEAMARALEQGSEFAFRALAVGDGLYNEPMAPTRSLAIPFDIREHLGRRGTSFLDRYTELALVACKSALADSGLDTTPLQPERIGIALGTDCGSLKSASDYSRGAQSPEGALLVSPILFPSTIMNFAASQAAIRFGMKGVNATVAGGDLAFLSGLRYVWTILRKGYADVMLCGGVEECTPHSSWVNHFSKKNVSALPNGEGAAIIVLQAADTALLDRRAIEAEVLNVSMGFAPGGEESEVFANALAATIGRALAKVGADPTDIAVVATGDHGETNRDQPESRAVRMALGTSRHEEILVKRLYGECNSASGALQVATVLARRRRAPLPKGELALITNRTAAGSYGVAVLRVWGRGNTQDG